MSCRPSACADGPSHLFNPEWRMNAPVAKLPGCFVPESKEHPTTFLTLTAVSGPWQGAGTALETRGLRAGATLHEHAGPEASTRLTVASEAGDSRGAENDQIALHG